MPDHDDLDLTHWWSLPFLAGLLLVAVPVEMLAHLRGRV